MWLLDIPIVTAFQRMGAGMNLFALMAIPFFIYAGELMNHTGIVRRLIKLSNAALGKVAGGLGLVNVASNMMFGAMSGSAVASASAMGSALIPEMKRQGYDADFAVNTTVTSATTGLLIPPSHNLIIYAIAAGGGISIASLFLAGLLPGLLLGLGLMSASYVVARRRQYPAGSFPGFYQLLVSFLSALPGLLSVLIILGGIVSGAFTSTEASAIAVIYTVLIAVFVYRSLGWSEFVAASLSAVRTTAMVLLVIGAASAFGWMLAVTEVPLKLSEVLLAVSDNPIFVLLLINVILLMLGTFMDMSPLIVICTPIFLPIAAEMGMDPVQFGVVLITNLGLGLVTPPVGSVLFVGCAIGGVRIEDTARTIWPFYAAFLATLALVTYWPALSLTLPDLLS